MYGGLIGAVAESFKLGPLRYVQYSFAQSLLRNIGLERIYEWMNLPTNTVDRLLCLEGEKLTSLSEQEISEVADSYKFFIWLFHRSQHAFIQEHQTVTYFGANEVKERIRNLEAILGTGKL